MNYYLWENGHEQGPLSPDKVRQLLAERAIDGDAYWRSDHVADWTPVSLLGTQLENDLRKRRQPKISEGNGSSAVGFYVAIGIVGIGSVVGLEMSIREESGNLVRSLAGIVVFGLSFVVALGLYALPTILAVRRKHPFRRGICVVNVFLGWTLLGWVGALAWAVSPPLRNTASPENNAQP